MYLIMVKNVPENSTPVPIYLKVVNEDSKWRRSLWLMSAALLNYFYLHN